MAMRPHDTKELQRTPARPTAPAGVGEAYDVERIRADFPILYRDVYGKPLVYLDNAASAQKPRQVIEAMDHVYRFEYANVHRGLPEAEAESLLLQAFVGPPIESVAHEGVREALVGIAERWLAGRG